jgi:hypothetical protein
MFEATVFFVIWCILVGALYLTLKQKRIINELKTKNKRLEYFDKNREKRINQVLDNCHQRTNRIIGRNYSDIEK